jgi:DNA-directed RNA polymerase sigma subunit (sigma70/sigma32)
MAALTARERKAVEMRYFEDRTYSEIGKQLQNFMSHRGNRRKRKGMGVTGDRAKHIIEKALRKMRERSKSLQWDSFNAGGRA